MPDPVPPVQGYGKSVAAVLAGSASIIIIYIIDSVLGHYGAQPLPAEIVAAVQTLLTTGAVFFVPHNFGASA